LSMEDERSRMGIVRLERVSKAFGRGEMALKEFDLTVNAGEVVVVTGPSGSGKTTLLRLVAGLESPSAGTLSIDGRTSGSMAAWERNVAMVFQHSVLMPHLTARENVTFPWRLERTAHGAIKFALKNSASHLGPAGNLGPAANDRTADTECQGDRAERLRQIGDLLEISSLFDRYPWELSGGERQRVAVGRALARRPAVFLLDEPFSSLDVVLRRRIQSRLLEMLRSQSAAVLFVTHDVSDVEALADRMVLLRQGEMEQVGTVSELRSNPRSDYVNEWVTAMFRRSS